MVVLCSITNLFGAEDLFLGTWKLNVARSKFASGEALQGAIATVKGGNGTHSVEASIQVTEGQTVAFRYVATDDGTPAPVIGSPLYDMVSARKVNDHTAERRLSKAGKTINQARISVSSDGKVLTIRDSSVYPKGRKSHSVTVYDKQ